MIKNVDTINTGDYVKVVEAGHRYPDYEKWLDANNLNKHNWRCNERDLLENLKEYYFKVIFKGEHLEIKVRRLYYIECIQTGSKMIIEDKGLRKMKSVEGLHEITMDIFKDIKI
jgi:hypothetical protein